MLSKEAVRNAKENNVVSLPKKAFIISMSVEAIELSDICV
jgi:hypothetical protein